MLPTWLARRKARQPPLSQSSFLSCCELGCSRHISLKFLAKHSYDLLCKRCGAVSCAVHAATHSCDPPAPAAAAAAREELEKIAPSPEWEQQQAQQQQQQQRQQQQQQRQQHVLVGQVLPAAAQVASQQSRAQLQQAAPQQQAPSAQVACLQQGQQPRWHAQQLQQPLPPPPPPVLRVQHQPPTEQQLQQFQQQQQHVLVRQVLAAAALQAGQQGSAQLQQVAAQLQPPQQQRQQQAEPQQQDVCRQRAKAHVAAHEGAYNDVRANLLLARDFVIGLDAASLRSFSDEESGDSDDRPQYAADLDQQRDKVANTAADARQAAVQQAVAAQAGQLEQRVASSDASTCEVAPTVPNAMQQAIPGLQAAHNGCSLHSVVDQLHAAAAAAQAAGLPRSAQAQALSAPQVDALQQLLRAVQQFQDAVAAQPALQATAQPRQQPPQQQGQQPPPQQQQQQQGQHPPQQPPPPPAQGAAPQVVQPPMQQHASSSQAPLPVGCADPRRPAGLSAAARPGPQGEQEPQAPRKRQRRLEPGGSESRQQQQLQPVPQQQPEPHELLPQPASLRGQLGPVALALVKQEQPAAGMRSQAQLAYWRLADDDFSAEELVKLTQHYLLPFVAQRHQAAATRSGAVARESVASIPVSQPRVERHYPALAPRLLQLWQQVPGLSGRMLRANTHRSITAGPAACRLLHALRCLRLWEGRQASQSEGDTPDALQCLAGTARRAAQVAGAAVAGAGARDAEVLEAAPVVDLVQQEQEEEQLQRFIAEQLDLLVVRERGPPLGGIAIKIEPE